MSPRSDRDVFFPRLGLFGGWFCASVFGEVACRCTYEILENLTPVDVFAFQTSGIFGKFDPCLCFRIRGC